MWFSCKRLCCICRHTHMGAAHIYTHGRGWSLALEAAAAIIITVNHVLHCIIISSNAAALAGRCRCKRGPGRGKSTIPVPRACCVVVMKRCRKGRITVRILMSGTNNLFMRTIISVMRERKLGLILLHTRKKVSCRGRWGDSLQATTSTDMSRGLKK